MKQLFLFAATLFVCLSAQAQEPREVQHFAHRASRFEFEENTLAAFQGTYDKGIRGYETDIRLTADGELVISHDETLSRLTPSDGNVEKMMEELGKAEAQIAQNGNAKIIFFDLCLQMIVLVK